MKRIEKPDICENCSHKLDRWFDYECEPINQLIEGLVEEYKSMHSFICKHLSEGMIVTERDGKNFDWYEPMQDGTMASFRDSDALKAYEEFKEITQGE